MPFTVAHVQDLADVVLEGTLLPAVAGRSLAQDPETLQEAARVERVLDGRTEPPAS